MKPKETLVAKAPGKPIDTINLRFTKEADKPECFDALEPGNPVGVHIHAKVHAISEKKGKEYEGDSEYRATLELSDYKVEVEPLKGKGAKSIKEAMEEVESKRKY
jgi:hypothetical protein